MSLTWSAQSASRGYFQWYASPTDDPCCPSSHDRHRDFQDLGTRSIFSHPIRHDVCLQALISMRKEYNYVDNFVLPKARFERKSVRWSLISFWANILADWKTFFIASSWSCLVWRVLVIWVTVTSSMLILRGWEKHQSFSKILLQHFHSVHLFWFWQEQLLYCKGQHQY